MHFRGPRLERDEVLFFCAKRVGPRTGGSGLGRAHEGGLVETRAIDRAERRRRRNEMYRAANAFGPARHRHANNGADLMAGGVIGRQSGTGKKNHGNVLQARASFYNRAQIFARDLLALALCLSENSPGSRGYRQGLLVPSGTIDGFTFHSQGRNQWSGIRR